MINIKVENSPSRADTQHRLHSWVEELANSLRLYTAGR